MAGTTGSTVATGSGIDALECAGGSAAGSSVTLDSRLDEVGVMVTGPSST